MTSGAARRLCIRHHDPIITEVDPMAFRPYLTFAGTCRDAFTRYREIFGGELVLLTMADTPAEAGPPPAGVKSDAIMHAALTIGDEVLMGSDDMSGSFDGNVNGI